MYVLEKIENAGYDGTYTTSIVCSNDKEKLDILATTLKHNLIHISEKMNNFRNYLTNQIQLSEISSFYALQHLRYFLEYLKAKGLSYLNVDELIDKKLINNLRPNSRQYKGDFIDEDEAKKILDYWKNSSDANNPRGIRNQLIMDLLWETGMTVSELAMLTVDDIDWKNGTLSLEYKDLKKKHKSRIIKLGSDSVVLLKRYFDVREDDCQALIVAFHSWNPYVVQAWPLTSRSIQRLIHNTATDLKISKKISPSVFRSSYYVKLLNEGLSLSQLNKKLGISGTSRQYRKYKDILKVPDNLVMLKNIAKEKKLTLEEIKKLLKSKSIPIVNFRHTLYIDRMNRDLL